MPYDGVITDEEIKELLHYLDYFQDSKSKFFTEKNGYRLESQEVTRFREVINDTGFLMVFDWGQWLDDNKIYKDINNMGIHERIMIADLETLRKLMTSYIRGDRFNEGLFIAVILKGHVTKILLRLQELMDS